MYVVAVQVKVKPGAENIARWEAAAFREKVVDLMAKPRRPVFYEPIAPEPWH